MHFKSETFSFISLPACMLTLLPFGLNQTVGKDTPNQGQEPWSSGYGGDSSSKGHAFESQHHILHGHFFTYLFVVKKIMCVCKGENK